MPTILMELCLKKKVYSESNLKKNTTFNVFTDYKNINFQPPCIISNRFLPLVCQPLLNCDQKGLVLEIQLSK